MDTCVPEFSCVALFLTCSCYAAFVDAYLIAIGAAGILWMFPVMFLDQFLHNALISRVWLESVWLCLAWILNLGMSAFVVRSLI